MSYVSQSRSEEEKRQRLDTRGALASLEEKIDLSLVDEVMRLIMTRGILQWIKMSKS